MKKNDCTEQEQWVLDQVKEGKFADLKNQFEEDEEKRRLRAKFLEALLTDDITEGNDKFKPHRKGIRIAQAVLAETLDLENAEIEHLVVLAHIVFQGKVILKGSHFHRPLVLNGSTFHQKANFNGMKVTADIILNGAKFRGPVDFMGMQLKGTFSATPLISNYKEPKPTKFQDQAVFGGAHIGGQFQAQGVQFLDSVNMVVFDGLTVGRSAFLSGAIFKGPVDFSQANIGDNFVADGVRFENIKPGASFNGLQVGQLASFKGVTFSGPAYFELIRVEGIFVANPMEVQMGPPQPTIFRGSAFFGGAYIGLQFQADAARFYEEADFNGLIVGNDAIFKNATFHGGVNFGSAHIAGHLRAQGSRFENEEQEVYFNSLKVDQSASFSGAAFHGKVTFDLMDVKGNFQLKPFDSEITVFRNEVSFGGAQVGGQFQAQNSSFEEVNCSGFKADMEVIFNNAAFSGPLHLEDANFLDLIIKGQDDGPPLSELHLERSVIKRRLIVENITVKMLTASHLRVDGPTTFKAIEFKEHADLRHGSHNDLRFVQTTWPAKNNEVLLDGLTYEGLAEREDGTEPDWKKILNILKQSRFNTRNYTQLEAYLHRTGKDYWANRVYISGKRRELRQKRYWPFQPSNWVTWVFWDLSAGYGRKPWRAFLFSLLIILLGVYFFNPTEVLSADMVKNYWLSPASIWQNFCLRLILSLNFFLPAIDLGFGKHLCLINMSYQTLIYFIIHRLLGWILIPIGLVAITTRLK